jgi:hypothetical protein
MLTILFILTCVFSNGLFATDAASATYQCSHSLPCSLSLCLSTVLPFPPFSVSTIKDNLIVWLIINCINAFDSAAVLISKVTSIGKVFPELCLWLQFLGRYSCKLFLLFLHKKLFQGFFNNGLVCNEKKPRLFVTVTSIFRLILKHPKLERVAHGGLCKLRQGILKGEVSSYRWPPVWLVLISLFCK